MSAPMTEQEIEAAQEYIKRMFQLHDPVLHIDFLAASLFAEVKRLRAENVALGMSPPDVFEELAVLWDEYATADDSALTADAIDLKNRLRDTVKKYAVEAENKRLRSFSAKYRADGTPY